MSNGVYRGLSRVSGLVLDQTEVVFVLRNVQTGGTPPQQCGTSAQVRHLET
jgi:hypothetical protein